MNVIKLDTTPLTLDVMQVEAYRNSEAHGFWDNPLPDNKFVPEKLALIHSEISEALEEYRNGNMSLYFRGEGKPEGFGVELADAIIRIGDLAAALGLDLSTLVRLKMAYNRDRPHKHGGKVI